MTTMNSVNEESASGHPLEVLREEGTFPGNQTVELLEFDAQIPEGETLSDPEEAVTENMEESGEEDDLDDEADEELDESPE